MPCCGVLVELPAAVNAQNHDHRCSGALLELIAVIFAPGRRVIDAAGTTFNNDWLVLNSVVIIFGPSLIVRHLRVIGDLIWRWIDLRHAVKLLVIWFSVIGRAVVIDDCRPFPG